MLESYECACSVLHVAATAPPTWENVTKSESLTKPGSDVGRLSRARDDRRGAGWRLLGFLQAVHVSLNCLEGMERGHVALTLLFWTMVRAVRVVQERVVLDPMDAKGLHAMTEEPILPSLVDERVLLARLEFAEESNRSRLCEDLQRALHGPPGLAVPEVHLRGDWHNIVVLHQLAAEPRSHQDGVRVDLQRPVRLAEEAGLHDLPVRAEEVYGVVGDAGHRPADGRGGHHPLRPSSHHHFALGKQRVRVATKYP
mmetsp:Transcript_30595/g.92582  ORF Transcript_30595/g.92582 Transcript_30595/m.92582 type:complete len:255 (+) Transcript_30595:135-899(+)